MRRLYLLLLVFLVPVLSVQPQAGFSSAVPSPRVLITGSLTSAQILALNGTPVTVIPAPGAGNVVVIELFATELVFGGTAYTGTSGISLTNTSGNSMSGVFGSGCITATSTWYCSSGPANISAAGFASVNFANSPVQIRMPSSQDLTGNGTLSYWISYRILTGF